MSEPPPSGGARARPSFAATYPEDAALDPLVAAFERGDFGRVRREAPRLIASGPDDVRAAAADLLQRTRPDPLARVFFALALGLLVFLAVYWWWKAGVA